jgi:hypothetical protein
MQVTSKNTHIFYLTNMKKEFILFVICILLSIFSQTCFAQLLKNEQAFHKVNKSVLDERGQLLIVMKTLDGLEKSNANEILNEYQLTGLLMEQFEGYLYLYSQIEKNKRINVKPFMNEFKRYYLAMTKISKDSLLEQQSYTKLPVLNEYAGKLKQHIHDSQTIVGAFEF